VVPRELWLDTLPKLDTRSLGWEVLEERVFGDVGVVWLRLTWEATLDGRDLTGEYAVTDVFTRVEGRWRASWRVSVRIPEAGGS
jgi:hypothetical protein